MHRCKRLIARKSYVRSSRRFRRWQYAPDETIEQVAARAAQVVQEVLPVIMDGQDVLLVAHAHILRVLTTQWLGIDPHMAKMLRLDTAHYSSLGIYKNDRVIEHWNL